jgi:EAL domain-containing protein (putative c-di-GMP-specific phosphodiesterase class I)
MKEKKVLIVDKQNNSTACCELTNVLKKKNWEIIFNNDFDKLVADISENKPDIIFVFLQETELYSNSIALQLITKDKNITDSPVFVFLLFNDAGKLSNLLVKDDIAGNLVEEKNIPIYRKPLPLENDLKQAIENKDFLLNYQPIVSLKSGKITGFESLVRWNHPEKGMIPPDEFIPLAEETELIVPLGYWIIEEAVRQIKVWQEKYIFSPALTVSINLSAVQFIHLNLVEIIKCIFNNYKIDPVSIRFEITESAFMKDMEAANMMLLNLKAMNTLLYMDDFGTGYSSLTYLKHFPVDALKIEKSFVKWMGIDEESEEIVSAVVNLAHNLKMFVIAEGVETKEHLQKLRNLNCDYGQGYFFSKPLGSDGIDKLLSSNPAW